jgi:hypothetical protein
MKKTAVIAALSVFLTGATVACASTRLEQALDLTPAPTEEVVLEQDEQQTKRWVCKGCTEIENTVLSALQDQGITDKIALSVLLGNIKQESKFQTTICEGGVRTGYHGCRRGGFGLIQWTTYGRYTGLGRVAREYRLDPNSLDAQLKWLFTEREWKKVEHMFRTEGQSMSYYMNAAHRWLGWGVHGARTTYSQQYTHHLHFE